MFSKRYSISFVLSVLVCLSLHGVAGAWTADLDINAVAEGDEENPGGYVALNDDDDNDNSTADKDEAGTVTGEDDLVELWLSRSPDDDMGTITLSATAGGTKIKVWTTATKGTEVSLPESWDLTSEEIPAVLYVEGVAVSGSERDVELTLEWTNETDPCEDKVKITVVKVEVTRIKFDHTAGHAADGIDIRENNSTDITPPEWIKGGQNKPAAYTKTTDVTIQAKFSVTPSSITSAKIRAKTSGSVLGSLCEQTVSFTSGVSDPEYISFTPVYYSPTVIDKGTVTWDWECGDIEGTGSGWADADSSGPHTIYTVLATPTAPMAEPWTEVLDKSCVWADGQSTTTGAAGDVTDSIYASGYEYDNVGGASQYYDGGDFNLTACLSEWGNSNFDINCWDCAQMVAIFSNALGCDLDTYHITCSCGGGGRGYLLNQIKPIGRDWTNDPFTANCRNLFSYHETAWPNIYDACLQVDSDANPIMQPCTGEQPKNMAFGDYRDKFVDPGDKTWVSGAAQAPASVK